MNTRVQWGTDWPADGDKRLVGARGEGEGRHKVPERIVRVEIGDVQLEGDVVALLGYERREGRLGVWRHAVTVFSELREGSGSNKGRTRIEDRAGPAIRRRHFARRAIPRRQTKRG